MRHFLIALTAIALCGIAAAEEPAPFGWLYVTGYTLSADCPGTTGGLLQHHSNSQYDAFVARMQGELARVAAEVADPDTREGREEGGADLPAGPLVDEAAEGLHLAAVTAAVRQPDRAAEQVHLVEQSAHTELESLAIDDDWLYAIGSIFHLVQNPVHVARSGIDDGLAFAQGL